MNKGITKIIFFLINITIIMFILAGCNFFSKERKEDLVQEQSKTITYLDLYKKQVGNFFDSREILPIDELYAALVKIEKYDEPVLIVYYDQQNEEKFIKIFYIESEEVKESGTYQYDEIKYLYNIASDKYEPFLYYNRDNVENYMSLDDIFMNNSEDIRYVNEKNYNSEYVKMDEKIEYTLVNKNNYEKDLDTVDQLYKNNSKESIEAEVKRIKENLVYAKDDEIVYKNYHMKYGRYSYGNYSYTFNKDGTFVYETNNIGNKLHIEGTCKYGYNGIYCHGKQNFNEAFEIVGDKQLKFVTKLKNYTNKIFEYDEKQ